MNEHDINEFLAPHALSGREREEVFERVLSRVAASQTPAPLREAPVQGRRRALVWAAIGVAACASLSALLVHVPAKVPFSARGAPTSGVHVQMVCAGASLAACPRGSHLLFAVAGGRQAGHLMAYAEPAEGGERIWYFWDERTTAPIAPGAAPNGPLELSIEIGPEHAVGKYLVSILVATHPLSRTEALHPEASSILSSETVELVIVP